MTVALGLASQTSSARADIPADIVLYASDAASIAGTWQRVNDSSAAGGARLWHPDAGVTKPAAASAAPRDFFELTFQAESGRPYRVWLRGQAQSNSYNNDSVFVQFSGSVTANGEPDYRDTARRAAPRSSSRIVQAAASPGGAGRTTSTEALRSVRKSTSPRRDRQTLRIQGREDGISVDQIVLSSAAYFTTRPGALKNDSTILPKTDSQPGVPGRIRAGLVRARQPAPCKPSLDVAAAADLNGDGRTGRGRDLRQRPDHRLQFPQQRRSDIPEGAVRGARLRAGFGPDDGR